MVSTLNKYYFVKDEFKKAGFVWIKYTIFIETVSLGLEPKNHPFSNTAGFF